MQRRRWLEWFFLSVGLWAGQGWGEEGYLALRGAVHVHSTFSTGAETIEQIAARAVAHGVEVLVMADDDLLEVEYGLPFLRRLVRFGRKEHSVLGAGALAEYLAEIRRVDALYPELIVIDGIESAPFYYWEIDLEKGRWTLRFWNKHLMAVGLGREEVYAQLPIAGNEPLEIWHWSSLLGLWPFLGLLYGWVARRRHPAALRYGVMIISGVCLLNNYPFKVPLWDAYHGDLGAAPYQHYIDYVVDRGGLVFWAHPESKSTLAPKELFGGRIQIASDTPPHPEDLLDTRRYTGFAALYGDNVTAIEPGREWDQVLQQYLRGEREQPVWGDGEIDYHYDDVEHQNQIHDILTVFLVRERTPQAVLEAMRRGRIYAVRGGDQRLELSSFQVKTDQGIAVAGERIEGSGPIRLQVSLDKANGQQEEVQVRLIKAGQVVAQFNGMTPLEFRHIDAAVPAGEVTYYRLLAHSRTAKLVSNPIFVAGGVP